MDFGRVITAMATPMAPDGRCDYARSAELANRLVDQGSDGIVVAGSTGESATLTTDERLRLFEAVVGAVGDRVAVIGNTGTNDTAASIELTRRAGGLGLSGVMAVTPYYNKPPQAGLIRHFSMLADATDLPVMMYNVPGRTGVNMTAQTTLELARISNIIAVKEASGNIDQIAAITGAAPPGLLVYSGDDALTLPVLCVGGHGVVSVASHLAAGEIRAMIEAFDRGDHELAAQIHHRLRPLFSALFVTTNPIPLKRALALSGFDAGPVRPPLVDADEDQTALLRSVLGRM